MGILEQGSGLPAQGGGHVCPVVILLELLAYCIRQPVNHILRAAPKDLPTKPPKGCAHGGLEDSRHTHVAGDHDHIIRHIEHQLPPKVGRVLTQDGRHISHNLRRGVTGGLDGLDGSGGCGFIERPRLEHIGGYLPGYPSICCTAWCHCRCDVCNRVGHTQGSSLRSLCELALRLGSLYGIGRLDECLGGLCCPCIYLGQLCKTLGSLGSSARACRHEDLTQAASVVSGIWVTPHACIPVTYCRGIIELVTHGAACCYILCNPADLCINEPLEVLEGVGHLDYCHSPAPIRVKGGELARLGSGRHTRCGHSHLRHSLDKVLKLLPKLRVYCPQQLAPWLGDEPQRVDHIRNTQGAPGLSDGKPQVIRVNRYPVGIHLVAEPSKVALPSKGRHPPQRRAQGCPQLGLNYPSRLVCLGEDARDKRASKLKGADLFTFSYPTVNLSLLGCNLLPHLPGRLSPEHRLQGKGLSDFLLRGGRTQLACNPALSQNLTRGQHSRYLFFDDGTGPEHREALRVYAPGLFPARLNHLLCLSGLLGSLSLEQARTFPSDVTLFDKGLPCFQLLHSSSLRRFLSRLCKLRGRRNGSDGLRGRRSRPGRDARKDALLSQNGDDFLL